jgi:hypothetical protein
LHIKTERDSMAKEIEYIARAPLILILCEQFPYLQVHSLTCVIPECSDCARFGEIRLY